MTTTLDRPVARYIAGANAQDIQAVTACFAEDAVVHDEGRRREGISAIREWAEEVSLRYVFMLDGEKIARLEIA
jgi:hypothetical protein